MSRSNAEKIPKNKFLNMTDLMKPVLNKGLVYSYPIYEYWVDIGKIEDYVKVGNDYTKVFSK